MTVTTSPRDIDTTLLDAARDIAPVIRAHSAEGERERRLAAPVLEALRETGLLRMTTPRTLGGLETDPVTRALVGEEIGRHDSAAGCRRHSSRHRRQRRRPRRAAGVVLARVVA